MFGMSGTEIAIILVLALLLLGPDKLPEVARGLGKGLRDFRRTTDDIRNTVETEFLRMDDPPARPVDPNAPSQPPFHAGDVPSMLPPQGAIPQGGVASGSPAADLIQHVASPPPTAVPGPDPIGSAAPVPPPKGDDRP